MKPPELSDMDNADLIDHTLEFFPLDSVAHELADRLDAAIYEIRRLTETIEKLEAHRGGEKTV